MNRQKTALDLAYEIMGEKNEKIYKPIIQKLYGIVYKTAYKYCRVDFLGEEFAGELKARNLSIDDYDDTMIGWNKVEDGFKKLDWYKDHIPNYKIYFWFAFKEGLYAWELNNKNYELNGGESQKRIGGTKNRGYDDYKDHYYIKKEFLIKIDDKSVWVHPLVEANSLKNEEKKKMTYKPVEGIKYSVPIGTCLLTFKKG